MFDIQEIKKVKKQRLFVGGIPREDIVMIKSVKINGKRKMRAVYDIKPIEK